MPTVQVVAPVTPIVELATVSAADSVMHLLYQLANGAREVKSANLTKTVMRGGPAIRLSTFVNAFLALGAIYVKR